MKKFRRLPAPHLALVTLDQRIPQSLLPDMRLLKTMEMWFFLPTLMMRGYYIHFENHRGTHGGFYGDMTKPFILTNNEMVMCR